AFEAVGDIIETNLVTLARQRVNSGVTVSDDTREIIVKLHEDVLHAMSMAVRAVKHNDVELARKVVAMKGPINTAVAEADRHQQQRLLADAPNRLAAYTFEMDVIENLKRIFYFAKRAARTVLPNETERRAAVEG
ncbi:MAG: Na/Pi cotransporter family protein, partial [Rhodospirillales bacterium]|nr:Na/Pi cotransporter family protein [Rhodospirillales bacterium]